MNTDFDITKQTPEEITTFTAARTEELPHECHLNPVVSVCIMTYNHEAYIAQALDGALMQETQFPIEILVGEDYSSDGTRDVVLNYQKKHPDRIRVILSTENLGRYTGNGRLNFLRTLNACRGKYIALCEGDDYWTDPLKLQMQVDFLEANPDCSLCFHPYIQVFVNGVKDDEIKRPRDIPHDNRFGMEDAILNGGGLMATCSMCLRRQNISLLPEWMLSSPVGDVPLMLLCATRGKLGYIDTVMSTHLVNTETSWSVSMQDESKRKYHSAAVLKMWDEFDRWSEYRYSRYVRKRKWENRLAPVSRKFIKWLKYRVPPTLLNTFKSSVDAMHGKNQSSKTGDQPGNERRF